MVERLAEIQELIFAGHERKVLIVLQGMDTGGKDGTIRHVMRGFNPQVTASEERRRLQARVEDPNKCGKSQHGDLEERRFWKDCTLACEEALIADPECDLERRRKVNGGAAAAPVRSGAFSERHLYAGGAPR